MKLLFVGDCLSSNSGLSIVTRKIIKYLPEYLANSKESITIAHLAISGQEFNLSELKINDKNIHAYVENNKIAIFPKHEDISKTHYEKVDQICATYMPDVVISNHDPWVVEALSSSRYRNSFVWIHYATIETPKYPTIIYTGDSRGINIKEVFNSPDLVIPVTRAAFDYLESIECKNLPSKHKYIYHGIEKEEVMDFRKKYRESKATRSSFMNDTIKESDFMFLTVGVNSDRKMLSRVLMAYDKFLTNHPDRRKDTKLLMHTDINTKTGGTDILGFILEHNLSDNILVDDSIKLHKGINIELLYKTYYHSDCFISLPGGEGFGMCYLEAMSFMLPVIYSSYGGHSEYCRAVFPEGEVQVFEYSVARNMCVKWGLADINIAADKMNEVYEMSKLPSFKSDMAKRYSSFLNKSDWKENIISKFGEEVITTINNNTRITGTGARRIL